MQKGLSSFASILAIMSLQSALDQNFQELGTYYPQLVNGLVATERVYEFLELEEEEPTITEETRFRKRESVEEEKRRYLEFQDVTFSYPEADTETKTVLRDFCLQIDKGEHVALVGESGCGKSTVIKLLSGLYQSKKGTISIDGVSTENMPLESLRGMISYVPQEPELYHATILENIRYGKWNATEEDIIKAAKQANAYEFIMNLPNGFDTVIEENGENLSGGQCQRIAIARALLKDAPIVIMDEATAALDHETENKINEMMQYYKDKTILMIAHRESTLKYADRMVRMHRCK